MKIEVDLIRIQDAPQFGRVAAVALLSALPHDEALLAIEEWHGIVDTREAYEVKVAGPFTEPVAEAPVGPNIFYGGQFTGSTPGADEPKSEPSTKAPDSQPDTSDSAKVSATYEKFTYGNRQFSIRKRGPSAAVAAALEDLTGCGSRRQLDAMMHQLNGLAGILAEIGRTDLRDKLNESIATIRDDLPEDEDAPAIDASPEPEQELLSFGEPQPDVAQPEPQRAGPPTPRAEPTNGSGGAPEPTLRDLMKEAMKVLGVGRVNDVLQRHGAGKMSDLTETSAAAVRTEIQAEMAALS